MKLQFLLQLAITFIHWRSQKMWLGEPKWKIFVMLFWWHFSVT